MPRLALTIRGTGSIIEQVIVEFFRGLVDALPRVLSAVVFLVVAWITIKLVLMIVAAILDRVYDEEAKLIVDLGVAVIGALLWFAAALALFKIIGMGEVAASIGTAAGFIGLGIAFALKEAIADTVAGVYLLRDEDFNHGDQVDTASVSGRIVGIDLRKTRLRTDDDKLVVLANRDVEKKWTQHEEGTPTDPVTD